MAVDDIQYRETNSLVLPSKTFFPLDIHVAHYQLRHYISSFEQDLIYYANKDHVYCLNVKTNHRKLITKLPFESRCTAAGHGWICVGGETEGQFAAIRLDRPDNVVRNEVDSLLPLELGSSSQSRRSGSPAQPEVHLERVGREIVNSISIHKLPSRDARREDDVVAVLTNNDNTVRIYSLTKGLQVEELLCPFAMNHATISPDGNLLLAVGDEHKAFIYSRQNNKTRGFGKSAHNDPESKCSWNILQVVRLHCPSTRDDIGYFTTAWSPSGSLCAVGSECGHITVLDTELLVEGEYGEEAIVQVIKSTRPDVGNGPGSVRAMLFAPQPWDLLIWSEDQGRVCASDLRAGLTSRQVLVLDPGEDGLQTSEVIDSMDAHEADLPHLHSEVDSLVRYRRGLDVEPNVNTLVFSAERRAGFPTRSPNLESDLSPLSPQDQHTLEQMRITRERNSGPERGIAPRSIHYHLPGSTSQRAHGGSTELNLEPNSDRGFALSWTSISLLRESLRDRYSDPERRLTQPHRQPPPVASNEDTQAGDASTGTSAARPIPPNANQSRTERSGSPNSYGWPMIEAAMMDRTRDYPSRPWGESATAAEARRFRQLARERERVREQNGLSRYASRRSVGAVHDPVHGVRTAGLAMSQDGRKIYVGTEQGIYVFSIDTMSRKMFPAITPR